MFLKPVASLSKSMSLSFDYIIVGGGSAGCVMANRLSASPGNRVLLIEAGMDTPPGQVPSEIQDSYPMGLFYGDRYIWPGLKAQLTKRTDGTPVERVYEQGRVMGGGSSINVQAANRGLPRDYDQWAQNGALGWSWEEVLPYFRRLERDLDCQGPLHGQDGPLPIRRILPSDFPAYATAVVAALSGSGLSMRLDQNGDFEDGLFPPAFSNERDQRASTAVAYLTDAVRQRENLTIWPLSRVIRLFFDGKRVSGVEVLRERAKVSAQARCVVLTAGALQTPALLLRAGIGDPEQLACLGVNVVSARSGVGKNLQDHPALTLAQYLPRHLRLPISYRRASFVAMRYSSGSPGADSSDMYVTASARAGWHALGQRLGLYFMWCNRPFSRGRLTLNSPDADSHPQIDLGLLSDERDMQRMMGAVRQVAELVVGKAINPNPDDLFPAAFTPVIKKLSKVTSVNAGLNRILGSMLDVPAPIRSRVLKHFMLQGHSLVGILGDDRELEAFVRRHVFGVWHASGTCRMGSADDIEAVVDPSGKVIGIENLYVSDASVMPRLPTANTNIPVVMIAEKISDALLHK